MDNGLEAVDAVVFFTGLIQKRWKGDLHVESILHTPCEDDLRSLFCTSRRVDLYRLNSTQH
jgi:hypothetical protein